MVRNHRATVTALSQSLHHLAQIHEAIIGKGLLKYRQRRGHIAQIDVENLALGTPFTDHLENVTTHGFPTFAPGADAQPYTPILAAVRQLFRPAVALGIGEDAWHTVHLWDRRIVRVHRQLHTCLLSNRQYGPQKVLEGRPYLVNTVLAPECQIVHLGAILGQIKLADTVAAAFDDGGRIGVARVPVQYQNPDAQFPQFAHNGPAF